jgi:hypothetical protein
MRSVVHIFTKPFAYDEGPKQCNEAYTRKPVLVKWIHGALSKMAGSRKSGLAWIIQCAVKRRWFLVGESPARELIRSAR